MLLARDSLEIYHRNMNRLGVQEVQRPQPDGKKKALSMPLAISIFFHALILLLIGGVVIVQGVIPSGVFVGETVIPSALVPEDDLEPLQDAAFDGPEGPDLDTPEVMEVGEGSPADVTFDVLTTVTPTSTFSLPVGASVVGGIGQGGVGFGQGRGGTPGRGGRGGTRVSFFGAEAEAERIGFYLDFSGTMDGQRRTRVLAEMKKTLEALPDGTEVLILIWAGETWQLGQSRDQVARYWTRRGVFEYELNENSNPPRPAYFRLDQNTRRRIAQLLEDQKQVSGATDWSSPFQLAARMQNPPDAVFLMTDGQHENASQAERFHQIIGEQLNRDGRRVQLNVVAIRASGSWLRSLQKLADDNRGKLVRVD